jgi:hypothetical protein
VTLALAVLAVLAAAVCLVTGVVYIGAFGSAGMPEVGLWLATLGALGASALAAVGLWQHLGDALPRLIALVVLSALAGGFIAANALALVQRAGIPQTPRPLHVAGLAVGSALYVAALVEASRAFRRHRGAAG